MTRTPFAKVAIAAGMLSAGLSAKPLDLQMGSRGFAMGGAFAAISDDATATYWNPAGLARIGSLTLSETNWILQDVEGMNVNYFTGAVPISQVGTIAGGWLMQHASLEQGEPGTALYGESDWYEHAFSLAAGRQLWEKLWIFEKTALGFSLDRYVLNSGELNGAGTGFDLGLITSFPHGLRLGWVMRSLGSDMMGDKIDPEYRLGLGYVWEKASAHRVTLAFDLASKENVEYLDGKEGVERNYKGFIGSEYRYGQADWDASLRAGMNSGFRNSRDMNAYTGGFGVGYRGISLEYAFQYNANQDLSLGQSHRFTLQLALGTFMGGRQGAASENSSDGQPAAVTPPQPAADPSAAQGTEPAPALDVPITEEERKKVEAIKAKYRNNP